MEKKFDKLRFLPHFMTYAFMGPKHKMTFTFFSYISGASTPAPTSAKVKVGFFGGESPRDPHKELKNMAGWSLFCFWKTYLKSLNVNKDSSHDHGTGGNSMSVNWKSASWCLVVTMLGR